MKHFLNFLLSACLILVLAGCKKVDFNHFQSYYFPKCNVTKFWTHWDVPGASQWDTLFSITYNKSTSYPEFIHCSFRTFAAPKGPFDFHIKYLPGQITVSDESTDNIVLKVWLNNMHRPDSAEVFDPLADNYRYRFLYQLGRLSNVLQASRFSQQNFEELFIINYDGHGNVTRMASSPSSGLGYDFKYAYNYKVADKQQFYLEEVNDDLWGFVLMRYLGMFYELQPHNERIFVDETDKGYRDYYDDLINHHYNQLGQLTDYSWSGSRTWNMVWKCN